VSITDAEQQELREYRRQDLLRRMREISRDHWSASWQSGLEHDLYLMTFHGVPSDYGMGVIAPAALAHMKRLAELTQTWWVGSDEPGSGLAVTLDEAEQRFSVLVGDDAHGVTHTLAIPDLKKIYELAAPNAWELEKIAAVWRPLTTRHVYRLRANPLITLAHREEEADWELRFATTTVDYVKPAWAKAP
jgi:hypothetical protein